jgi:RNA polymerase sigma-70 factor (ECF subfamily)
LSKTRVLDYPAAGAPLVTSLGRTGLGREMPVEESDRDLVALAQAGDAAAFGRFVRRHQRRVFRLASHLLKNTAEAEDVTQEAFVRAFGAIQRFDGRSEPFTWLYRIAVNLSLNTIRSRKTKQTTELGDDPRIEAALVERRPGMADPARQATEREMAVVLCQGIDSLSETLRTTLVLVAIDGLSHAEASSVLGCPEGTVAWRVHEARKKLKEFLAERGHSSEAESDR